METATFNIPSISCSACSGKIQDGIKGMKGVGGISVDLKTQAVKVDYDPQEIQATDIRSRISSMGYEVIQ